MYSIIKKVMKRLVIPIVTILFIYTACEREVDNREFPDHDPSQPVHINTFFPDSGRVREHVLIEGVNFGSDPSIIKVFFDDFEARVVGANGTSIYALVPRVAGAEPDIDNVVNVSVQINDAERITFPNPFRYRVSASVTTFAGNGENVNDWGDGRLDRLRLDPVFIGVDSEFNIFVTTTNHHLLLLNERDNTVIQLMNQAQGMNQHNQPNVGPGDVIMMGHNSQRDRFTLLDPAEGWAPKAMFIRGWDETRVTNPQDPENTVILPMVSNNTHHFLVWCSWDDHFYTRYSSGQIVRICPNTWRARIIGMSPSGQTYSAAFNPDKPSELWIGYDFGSGEGAMRNSLVRLDVSDERTWEEVMLEVNPEHDFSVFPPPYGTNIMYTFEKMSGATGGGHRDGPLHDAEFNGIRQLNFDQEAGILYIGDSENHCIRMINMRRDGFPVSTLIGIPRRRGMQDGAREDALFSALHGIVADGDGVVYVSDWSNKRIRRIAVE
jgi:hypothetical protein